MVELTLRRAEAAEQTQSLSDLTKTLSESREMAEKFHKEVKGKNYLVSSLNNLQFYRKTNRC